MGVGGWVSVVSAMDVANALQHRAARCRGLWPCFGV